MENSIFELFETIFSEDPKPANSISVEINILDTSISNTSISETQLSDNFEILLHMFIYGFKKLKLTFTEESLSILKKYFASLNFTNGEIPNESLLSNRILLTKNINGEFIKNIGLTLTPVTPLTSENTPIALYQLNIISGV
jgi:hypothetical protein